MLSNFLHLLGFHLHCRIISLPFVQFLSELYTVFRGNERRSGCFAIEDSSSLELRYLVWPNLDSINWGDCIHRVLAVHHSLPYVLLLLNVFSILVLDDILTLSFVVLVWLNLLIWLIGTSDATYIPKSELFRFKAWLANLLSSRACIIDLNSFLTLFTISLCFELSLEHLELSVVLYCFWLFDMSNAWDSVSSILDSSYGGFLLRWRSHWISYRDLSWADLSFI